MSGETTVGSILGFLRLDADQFHREIQKAMGEAQALDGTNVDVKVKADTAGAERGLGQVARSSRTAASGMDQAAIASRRLADASDKVKIAEAKLAEVNARKNVTGSQILTATRQLTLAKREESDATTALSSATSKAAADVEKVDVANKKADKSSRDAGKGMGALATAIITLGPALVPVAAGAAGVGAAFGAMGAAGILALVGVASEMKKGTTLGLSFKDSLDRAQTSIMDLAKTAAGNVLAPLQTSVAALERNMPQLNGMVDEFSTMTGKAAASITTGLLNAFVALEPLMRDAAGYVLTLSQRFESAMSGGGVTAFGDYARSVLPQVVATLESLVTSAVHLVAAFAPLGMGTLSTIKVFADLIAGIDPGALTAIATAAGAVFAGFKTWQGLSGLVAGLGAKLEGMGVSAERAAGGMRALNIASGVIGVAIAALSFIMTANAESNRANEQAANDYADALRASNGAIDESIQKMAAKQLSDSGALTTARELGLNLQDVTAAALGNADAQGRLKTQIDAAREGMRAQVNATGAAGAGYDDFNGKVAEVQKAIGGQNAALDAGAQKQRDLAAATAATAAKTSDAAVKTQALAATYGVSVPVLQSVTDGQKKAADAAAGATVKMQLENDAAGILKQSLDALNGKSLSAADATNAFESSLVNMGDHVTKTGAKVHFTTKSITNMSAASVALRGQLNGQVANLQRVVEANGGLSNSTGKAREQMVHMRKQIIDNAVAHGVDRKAVTAYIDKLMKIPRKIPPTKLDTDKAAAQQKVKEFIGVVNGVPQYRMVTVNAATAAASAAIEALHREFMNKGWTLTATARVNMVYVGGGQTAPAARASGGLIPAGRASGGPIPGYAGGTLVGPGTGTSDSILAMVAQTGRMLRVSAGEFVSTDASRRRNEGALQAGNRGARLEVAGGPTELGEASLQRLAVMISRIKVESTVSAGSFDRAMGARLW